MRLTKPMLALIAAIALIGSTLAPISAATTDTEPISITLTDTGVFAVEIIAASLGSLNVDATTGGVSNGGIQMKYTDTKTYRQGFFTSLSSTDFASLNIRTRPYQSDPGGNPYTISANNLKITRNYDVFQGRWSSWSVANGGPVIGDIGATSNGDDTDSSSGPFCCTDPSFGNTRYHDWSSAVNNTLADDGDIPVVGFGFNGPGTAGPFSPTYGSLQVLSIALTVPAGQPADIYQSTLTVTVTSANIP